MDSLEVLRSGDIESGDGHTLIGYPIVWDKETIIYDGNGGYFIEKVRADAVDVETLVDVVLNVNHDDNQMVARTLNNTLSFVKDDYGLKMIARLGDALFQKDTYEKVKQGLLNKMSFNALVRYEDSTNENGELVRTVVEIGRLKDVSLVTRPAYEDTSVIARSKGEEDMNKDKVTENTNENTNENTSTEQVDEQVVEDTTKEVEEDIKDNAEENGIDYDLLAEKVAEKLQPKETEKEDEKGDEEMNKEKDTVERSKLDMEKMNDMSTSKVEIARASDEYLKIWARGVRDNDMREAKRFLATHKIDTNSDGSKLVPTKLEESIITGIRNGGHIANLCTSKSVRGILEHVYEKSATDAGIHEEGAEALPEEKIEFDSILIEPKYIKKWIMVTDRMEDMTDMDLANYLIEEITNKVLEFLDNAIIGGTNGIKGIAKNSNEMFVKKVAGITTDAQLATCGNLALAELQNVVNPIMVVTQKFYYTYLATLTDTTGKPLATTTTIDGIVKPMWNGMIVEFTTSSEMANTKNDTSKPFAIVGNFKAYELNCPNGYDVQMLRDPYTKAPENMIRYIGKLLVGGDVIVPHAFATLTMGAGA